MAGPWPVAIAERTSRAHGRRTLVRILDAAVGELDEHGFHGARMGRIAKAAGVAHGTVYVYFADKDDLLAALQRDVDAQLQAVLDEMPSMTGAAGDEAAVRAWVGEASAVFVRHGAVFEALAQVLTDDRRSVAGRAALRSMSRATSEMAARIRASRAGPRTGRDPIDADVAALCLFAAIEGVSRSIHRGDLDIPEEAAVAELARFVVCSLDPSAVPLESACDALP